MQQIPISQIRDPVVWLCDLRSFLFYLLYSAFQSTVQMKIFPATQSEFTLLSSHLIGTMWWYVVVIHSCKHVLVLLYILAVDCGEEGEQQTPVFIICYSAPIVTFPWERTKKSRMKG